MRDGDKFTSFYPRVHSLSLAGSRGDEAWSRESGRTAQACPVPGGQGLRGVDGGSSCAALPLPRCRGRRRRLPPQRVARATTVGGPSPADDEVGGGRERWRTRPTDVDEMTKDLF